MRAFSRRSNSRPASETSTTRAAVAGWSARKSRASPRTTDDESSFQELDRIVFVEHADVDQPAVLPTGPASCSDRGLGHAVHANARRRHGSMPQARYTASRGQITDIGPTRLSQRPNGDRVLARTPLTRMAAAALAMPPTR